VFQKGWIGGLLHLLMWGDFVVYYVYGLLYKTDIAHLYDPAIQESSQLHLISPTIPPGVMLYGYPPYAALLLSILSYLSLPSSLVLRCLLSIFCVILSAQLLQRFLILEQLLQKGSPQYSYPS
jgi:hypothetical protein